MLININAKSVIFSAFLHYFHITLHEVMRYLMRNWERWKQTNIINLRIHEFLLFHTNITWKWDVENTSFICMDAANNRFSICVSHYNAFQPCEIFTSRLTDMIYAFRFNTRKLVVPLELFNFQLSSTILRTIWILRTMLIGQTKHDLWFAIWNLSGGCWCITDNDIMIF